ncbi:metallo-beta-lactamase class B [Kriegella aquimaris]|uniref:beta-lactamase n=1 Tax=Kriegella aquimaris TaxID=192904 RepID=A0A1G9NLS3_9FLAO|nr:metallo-beta-lactamase class B [Kriegella aquimaris]
MIIVNGDEAVVFDTPTTATASTELIDWIVHSLNCKIIAILPTHFHSDCLGGIATFHERNISSYAHKRTIEYANENIKNTPKNEFETQLELMVGGKKIIAEFFGEGHTKDNIIGYFPEEKVIFGGCLIKSLNAQKGYLGDANVKDWSSTVRKLKAKYGGARIVIPGHGKVGGIDLLDYTINLFEDN